MRQPCDGIAEAAFDALTERMRYPSLHVREILLPAPLVVRESTQRK
jgi:DNA-binding LacI/PurR family transcriptional regulator